MKHTLKVTIFLLIAFFVSQVVGLAVTNQYIDYSSTVETGDVVYSDLPFDMERPDVGENYAFLYIMFGVMVGTGILLLMIKFKRTNLWKIWYFLAIVLALTAAFAGFIDERIALAIALVLALAKVFRPNIIVNNLAELFIYGGLAAIFVPVINVFSAILLLILISIYDMYAVWKSKHMVKMAKFQTKAKLFAGLSIPYTNNKSKTIHSTKKNSHNHIKKSKVYETSHKVKKSKKTSGSSIAILGGGDIAFPLIFTAVIMKDLIGGGVLRHVAFLKVLIITLFVTVALAYIFIKGEKGKFYPAMPFVTIGCLIGYGIMLVI